MAKNDNYTSLMMLTQYTPNPFTREKLSTMVREELKHNDPDCIDKLLPEETLHQFDNSDVIDVAHEYDLPIVKCATHTQKYKANGIWVNANEKLLNKLNNYKNISHGACDHCVDAYRKEIARVRAELGK